MNTFEAKLDEVQRILTQQQLNEAARATLRAALDRDCIITIESGER